MQSIFAQLMASYPGIEKIDVFSDGPTSQFKQRFLFSNLYGWEMENSLKISWNFFAISHGKGVVDGIGGTVKRAVWRYVKAEQSHVTDLQQYAALARQLCPKVRIEYIPKEEIAKHTSFPDKKWETTKAIPGTHQVHCVQADGSDYVIVSHTTNSAESRRCQIRTFTNPSSINPEVAIVQWAVVNYDGEQYPGEITAVSHTEGVEVSALHKSGSGWKWSQSKDSLYYYYCKKDTSFKLLVLLSLLVTVASSSLVTSDSLNCL